MAGVSVTRVIPAPVEDVWRAFTDPVARREFSDVTEIDVLTPGAFGPGFRWRETRTHASGESVTEELVVVAVEDGRACTVALDGAAASGQLRYTFAPVISDSRRPATVVTVSTERQRYGLANRLLGFFVGGFAARTAEGALRSELDALAAASRCTCAARGGDAAA